MSMSREESKQMLKKDLDNPDITLLEGLNQIYHWFMFEWSGQMIDKYKAIHLKHCDKLNENQKAWKFRSELNQMK